MADKRQSGYCEYDNLCTVEETGDTQTDSDADIKANSDTDAKTDSDADTQANSDADAKTDSDADTQANSDADAKADSDTDAKANGDTDTKTDSDADIQTDSGTDTKANSDTNTSYVYKTTSKSGFGRCRQRWKCHFEWCIDSIKGGIENKTGNSRN